MSFTSVTPQWAPVIDLDADLKSYLQYPADKTDQDVTLTLILDAVNDWLSTYLQRPIAPTRFFERFDGWSGWGGAYVMLPYSPVLEIVSMTEYWGLNGGHQLVEQTPQNQYGVGFSSANPPGGTYQLNPRTGTVIRTFPGLVQKPFFPGSRNVEIEWIAGFDPIPAQIKLAALELATWWYRNTQEQPEIASPRAGYDDPATSGLWPAIPNRVTALLEPYVQQGIG